MLSVSPSHKSKQQGAALILALVVVVIVTLLATTLKSDFLVTLKRVENQLHGKQAFAYMVGVEGIAREVLQTDLVDGPNKDHRSEGWLNKTIEYPTEWGAIAGTLCDLQGRFNLNSLSDNKNATAGFTPAQERFIRLLQTLELAEPIDQSQAEYIASAVSDWVDSDSNVRPEGGAEDGYYADLELPYKPANRAFNSVSELRWVKGITPQIYQALAPYVTALDDSAKLNVNTAEATVLRAINVAGDRQALSELDAELLIEQRDGDITADFTQHKTGYDKLKDFTTAHPASKLSDSGLAIKSEYFLLKTESIFLTRAFTLYSVLHRRQDGSIKTIARGQSGFGECMAESVSENLVIDNN
ncbi:type II secretion system minor pseudopilin GspK [uncultured Oceanicoccus sp.]|uniref:type II secretion system minor pseudopilin GspK n=1 Tax=uncultured Oceanicoccus sp. TaxID=1706381 RepID=UPI0030D9FF91